MTARSILITLLFITGIEFDAQATGFRDLCMKVLSPSGLTFVTQQSEAELRLREQLQNSGFQLSRRESLFRLSEERAAVFWGLPRTREARIEKSITIDVQGLEVIAPRRRSRGGELALVAFKAPHNGLQTPLLVVESEVQTFEGLEVYLSREKIEKTLARYRESTPLPQELEFSISFDEAFLNESFGAHSIYIIQIKGELSETLKAHILRDLLLLLNQEKLVEIP